MVQRLATRGSRIGFLQKPCGMSSAFDSFCKHNTQHTHPDERIPVYGDGVRAGRRTVLSSSQDPQVWVLHGIHVVLLLNTFSICEVNAASCRLSLTPLTYTCLF